MFLLILGVVCIFFGGRFAVDFAVVAAHNFHIPVAAVALTAVAFGTSLPELFATTGSALRGHSNSASGQLIASGVFNILLVMGVVALVHPVAVAPILAQRDGPIMVASLLLLLAMMLMGWRLTRVQGAVLLVGYAAYVASVALRSGLHLFG